MSHESTNDFLSSLVSWCSELHIPNQVYITKYQKNWLCIYNIWSKVYGHLIIKPMCSFSCHKCTKHTILQPVNIWCSIKSSLRRNLKDPSLFQHDNVSVPTATLTPEI